MNEEQKKELEKDLEDCFEYLYYKNSEVVNVGALKELLKKIILNLK